MSTIADIESAIERLPAEDVAALAVWLEALRRRGATKPVADAWLNQAKGAARSGLSTADVMRITRGEE